MHSFCYYSYLFAAIVFHEWNAEEEKGVREEEDPVRSNFS